jgi:hypothetical protein
VVVGGGVVSVFICSLLATASDNSGIFRPLLFVAAGGLNATSRSLLVLVGLLTRLYVRYKRGKFRLN